MIRIFSQYVSPKSLLLVVLETGLVLLGLLCGARLRFWGDPAEFETYIQAPQFVFQMAIFAFTMLTCFYYGDLYDFTAIRTRRDQLVCLGQSFGAACLLLGLLYFIFPALLIGRGVFFISTALVAAFVWFTRLGLDTAWRIAAPMQNVLVLGSEQLAMTVVDELVRRDDLHIKVVGFLRSGLGGEEKAAGSGLPVLGELDDLERIVERHQVSRIVVALEDRRGCLPVRDLVRLKVTGVRVDDAQSTISSLTGRIWLDMVRPSWFVFSDGFHRSRFTPVWKRIIDLVLGIVGLIFAAPIMALVAIAVRLDSRGPVFFSQTRVGFKGKTFEVLKFRSMRVDAEAGVGAQWASQNDPRVTRVGRYLRKFRLDEIPQLINVIRGEMSFVGPRPERPVFVERLRSAIAYYDERHTVRPGVTGWAQVQYTYGASTEDAFRKLEYDLFYLKNMSLMFDCMIVLKTIRIILAGQGGW